MRRAHLIEDLFFKSQKSPAKQIGHNLRKTFKCVPNKTTQSKLPQFPDTPEKTIDLSYIMLVTLSSPFCFFAFKIHNWLLSNGPYFSLPLLIRCLSLREQSFSSFDCLYGSIVNFVSFSQKFLRFGMKN